MEDNLDSLLDDMEDLSIYQIEEDLGKIDKCFEDQIYPFREEIKKFRCPEGRRIIKIKSSSLYRVLKIHLSPKPRMRNAYEICHHLSGKIEIRTLESDGLPEEGEMLGFSYESIFTDTVSEWRFEQKGLMASIRDPFHPIILYRIFNKFISGKLEERDYEK